MMEGGKDENASVTEQLNNIANSDDAGSNSNDSKKWTSWTSMIEIQNLNEIPSNLRMWNIVAAIFQFAQCIALFYLSSQANTNWYLYTHFPGNFDERQQDVTVNGTAIPEGIEDDFGRPEAKEIAAYSVTWYSAVFILLSGLDHMVVALPGVNSVYNWYIARHQAPFRWAEYSLSASLMRVMIAQLSGVTDIHLLFSIFMASATTMVLGGCHESVNAKARADSDSIKQQNWYPFLVSFIPHFSSWAIIYCYFFTGVSRADAPAFVYAIVIVLFILDGPFALLFYLQWAKIGLFQDYVTGEKGFIVLSFTAKTLLAWLNYVSSTKAYSSLTYSSHASLTLILQLCVLFFSIQGGGSR